MAFESLKSWIGEFLLSLGKGPGFIVVGVLEVIGATIVALTKNDLTGYAMAIGALNVPLYGGGAWKASAEAKAANGNGNGKHPV